MLLCRHNKIKKVQENLPSVGISMSILTGPNDSSASSRGKQEVTSRPVPVSEFGSFVSEHHAHGNKKFKESYEV